MNFPIAVLLLCALIGLADKMIGGRFGLAEEFDRGMTMMGSLTVTMSGVYCFPLCWDDCSPPYCKESAFHWTQPFWSAACLLLIWVLIPSQIPSAPIIHKNLFWRFAFRYTGNYHLFFSSNCFGKYSLQRFQESDDRNGLRHHCYSGCSDYRKLAF